MHPSTQKQQQQETGILSPDLDAGNLAVTECFPSKTLRYSGKQRLPAANPVVQGGKISVAKASNNTEKIKAHLVVGVMVAAQFSGMEVEEMWCRT